MSDDEGYFTLPEYNVIPGSIRPTKYDPKKLVTLLENVARGQTLTQAAKEYGIDRDIIYHWRVRFPELGKALDAARAMGEDAIADDCLDIADNTDESPDSRKVRVWTRLQLLKAWNPKKWGDRVNHNHSHDFTKELEEARARIVSTH
jgi:hypothetical protein